MARAVCPRASTADTSQALGQRRAGAQAAAYAGRAGQPGDSGSFEVPARRGGQNPFQPCWGWAGGPQNKLLESAVLNPHSPTSSNPFAWHSSHGFQKLRLGGGFWPILASLLGDLGQVTSPAGWV